MGCGSRRVFRHLLGNVGDDRYQFGSQPLFICGEPDVGHKRFPVPSMAQAPQRCPEFGLLFPSNRMVFESVLRRTNHSLRGPALQKVMRTHDGLSEPNVSASPAPPRPSNPTVQRGRYPAASMIGNKYRKPTDTSGFVNPSVTAIATTTAALTTRTRNRLQWSHRCSKVSIPGNSPALLQD